MLKKFWAAFLTGMASTLGAIVITEASKSAELNDVKSWLKNKFNKLKNRIHRRKNEP